MSTVTIEHTDTDRQDPSSSSTIDVAVVRDDGPTVPMNSDVLVEPTQASKTPHEIGDGPREHGNPFADDIDPRRVSNLNASTPSGDEDDASAPLRQTFYQTFSSPETHRRPTFNVVQVRKTVVKEFADRQEFSQPDSASNGDVKSPAKASRIPWTTRLIQKITEEEDAKKTRKPVQRTRTPPKRSAIYERTDKSSPWLTRGHVPPPPPLKKPEVKEVVSKPKKSQRESIRRTPSTIETDDGLRRNSNKDRYAELINELVVEEPKESPSLEKVKKTEKRSPLRNIFQKKVFPTNSEPKVKTSRRAGAPSKQQGSPTRAPFLETAFVSDVADATDGAHNDAMFKRLESKFSSSGGFLRQKVDVKPVVAPKPKTGGRTPTTPTTPTSDPVYANDVFFRKKREVSVTTPDLSPGRRDADDRLIDNIFDSVDLAKDHDTTRSSNVNLVPQLGQHMRSLHFERGYYQDVRAQQQANSRPQPLPDSEGNFAGRQAHPPHGVASTAYQTRTQSEHDANHNGPNQRQFAHATNAKFDEYVQDRGNRSSSSSTSTIVSESAWKPEAVNLEKTAISGSPEIRKLQQRQIPEFVGQQAPGGVKRSLVYDQEQIRRSQMPLRVQTDELVASGRVSAPPIAYHERRVQSPSSEPRGALRHSSPKQMGDAVTADHVIRVMPQRAPLVGKNPKYFSLDANPAGSGMNPGRLLVPVGAQVRISTAPGEVKRGQAVQNLEANLARSLAQPTQLRVVPLTREQEAIYAERVMKGQSLPAYARNANVEVLNRSLSPNAQYRKLSKQEVEQLYWQTQQIRDLQAAQLSPASAQFYRDQYRSTGSLRSSPNQRPQSLNDASFVNQSVPNLKTSPINGSQQQPPGNTVRQLPSPAPQHVDASTRIITINNQRYLQNVADSRIRSRSVSPGPNLYAQRNAQAQYSPQHAANLQRSAQQYSPQNGAGVPRNGQQYSPQRGSSLPRNVQLTSAQHAPYYHSASDGENHFVRGAAQRNTIGPIRSQSSTPLQNTTIYENAAGVYDSDVELRHPEKMRNGDVVTPSRIPNGNRSVEKDKKSSKKDKKPKEKVKEKSDPVYAPIFKRGSLVSISNSSVDNDSPTAPKRVSFSSGRDSVEQIYWPTRNGLAPEPPTRQRKSRDSYDSDVFLPNTPPGQYVQNGEYLYTNVGQNSVYGVLGSHDAPDRPLPPIPAHLAANGGTDVRAKGGERRVAGTPGSSGGASPANRWQHPVSESESGSEAGEVQRILQQGGDRRITYFRFAEEEWGVDGKPRGPPGGESSSGGRGGSGDDDLRRGGGGGRGSRREEPRRHTLSGDHHQGHHGGSLARSMDLEMSSKQRRKSPLPRGYPPPSSAMLFDDDPGIMSEVETSSTGFHRGGKQRSSLPVVRTPSKTLERPLGLVFLQYRNETKRALLPNEITSLDTVRALFVRSFPKQLNMEYLDSHMVKIYIHDSSKDMFYELEDLRTHLRDIRDRSVLRLFESADVNGGVLPVAGVGVAPPVWHEDQSYFSEPEFDSEYQHQHIHKSKSSSKPSGGQPYYMTHSYPPGGGAAPATLPRGGGAVLRAYSPAAPPPLPADRIKTLPQAGVGSAPPKPVRSQLQHRDNAGIYGTFGPRMPGSDLNSIYVTPDRLHSESGYMSSPERGVSARVGYTPAYMPGGNPAYEDPYYSQYPRSGSVTPVIDEEASDTDLLDESYTLYGVKLPGPLGGGGGGGRSGGLSSPRGGPFPGVPYDQTRACLSRIRVEHMERQLANLTGLVQKALTHSPTPREYLQVPGAARDASNYRNAGEDFDKHSSSSSASLPDEAYLRSDAKPPKLGKGHRDKSVSFEKSVSFSDEPPDMNSPKQHSPQHSADSKPPKPAIKSSTLPRMSSQERNDRESRHKPAPPPKPVALSPAQYEGRLIYRDLQLTPEMYNQLRGLQKKAKELRGEVRSLRRMSQAQAHSVRESIRDTFIKIRAMLVSGGPDVWAGAGGERGRLSREEEIYKQEMIRLENDLTELEQTVEELRGNVINRKTRVNMSDVEDMALVLSKSSKTVADLKVRFPGLHDGVKTLLSAEMERVVREEKFLVEEPERLESALRRCKKLTGTLVTLKRLASVQEQRLPPSGTPEARLSPTLGDSDETPPITPPAHGKAGAIPAGGILASGIAGDALSWQRPENALDALLDELQTFARPPGPGEVSRKGSVDSQPPSTPGGQGTLRRLHSYPSSSDGGGSSPPTLSRLQDAKTATPKPPVPERNAELLAQLAGRRVPPPPPPRTSSRSPLASPTSPSLPPRGAPAQPQMGTLRRGAPGRSSLRDPLRNAALSEAKLVEETNPGFNPLSASNSSSCESVNSQEGVAPKPGKQRQEVLEQRHQELLRKQRALQEQYARLQQLQRGAAGGLAAPDLLQLKKTGSESNLLAKMGLGLSAASNMSGSLTHLASSTQPAAPAKPTSTKVYETDIL